MKKNVTALESSSRLQTACVKLSSLDFKKNVAASKIIGDDFQRTCTDHIVGRSMLALLKKFSFSIVSAIAFAPSYSFAQMEPTAVYEYDALGRLVKASYENSKSIRYTYDAAGNRSSVFVDENDPIGLHAGQATKVILLPLIGFVPVFLTGN